MPPLTPRDRQLIEAVVAEVLSRQSRIQDTRMTNDERVAVDRAMRQIAQMKPGQTRARPTLDQAAAASRALNLGHINVA